MVRQALTTVGSDPDCHLVLTDAPALAPRHAQFKESSAGVFLSALTPEAAILRNGAPLTDTVRLVHDDQLDLGGLLIQFQEIIAPHTRLEPSPGLIQPITLLLAIVILVVEAVMLGFMFDWRTRLITPDAEARDLAWAEEYRAQVEAEKEAKLKNGEAPASSVIVLPGTTDTAPPHATATNHAAEAGTRPDEPPTSAAAAVLDVADFTPATTNTPLANLPPVSAADPAIAAAQRTLAEATAAAQFADYARAFRLLNQIHQDQPGFLPAHVEHARLLETRGNLDEAYRRWGVVLGVAAPGSPFRARAERERQRLAELRELQSRIPQTSAGAAPGTWPRQVRIAPPQLQRMPADEDVAEMRVLDAELELAPDAKLFSDAAIQVFVTFYDADPDGSVRPTRALVPPSPIALGQAFADRRSVPLHATYVVPRGLREQELRETGRRSEFYGYVLHVFAGQTLQDAFAKPKKLLDLPIHVPAPAAEP